MMWRTAAASAIALALGLIATEVRAEPLTVRPLTSAPLVYDADNTLIGPHFGGVTYLTFQGRIFGSLLYSEALLDGGFTLYYKNPSCVGQAYLTVEIVPFLYQFKGNIFYPEDKVVVFKPVSSQQFSPSGKGACTNGAMPRQEMSPVLKRNAAELGIRFPVHAAAPQ